MQNNEFILANPEMKAKIVAASRRGSNSKEVTARSSLICVGGEGKDGLQGTLFYFKNQQQWHALTRYIFESKKIKTVFSTDLIGLIPKIRFQIYEAFVKRSF